MFTNEENDTLLNALENSMGGHLVPPSSCGCKYCSLWLRMTTEPTVWQAKLTEDMVKGMDSNEIEILIADLDDAVAQVCQDYEVK